MNMYVYIYIYTCISLYIYIHINMCRAVLEGGPQQVYHHDILILAAGRVQRRYYIILYYSNHVIVYYITVYYTRETLRPERPWQDAIPPWVPGGGQQSRGGEGAVDWDAVASNRSTGSCLYNFNKRMKSKRSNWEIWARWRFPPVSSPLPNV